MATELQRARKLDKNIATGRKQVMGVLSKRRRSVKGVIVEYAEQSKFVTNANLRNKLYNELYKEYQVLNTDINKWTVDSVDKTAKDFWNYAQEDLPKGSVGGTFGAFSAKYVDDIIREINPSAIDKLVAINAHIGGMAQNDIRTLQAAVSTTIAEGAVEGLTNKELAARMKSKVIASAGQFKFVDAAGRRWTADNYFGMLNRTLHANAARQSYIATATNEAGFDLYQIEGGVTGSSVENPNDPCDNWAGKIISMTGQTRGYPTYQDTVSAGMWHPGCLHFLRAIMPSEIKQAKKERAAEGKEAAELGSKRLSTTI